MTHRERFLACILGEPVDRPPFWLFWGPWGGTWQRWIQEGKPEDANHRSLFDPDPVPAVVPVNCGPCPSFPRTVLQEDTETIVHIDTWGITRRDFKYSESMSQFLEFPVRDRKDWERYKQERLDPDHPDRLAGEWKQMGKAWMEQEIPIQIGYFPDVGVFGGLRWLLGDEECLIAFYTMPDLVHEIMDHLTSVYLTVFEKVAREIRVDVIHIWEDMCGRQGPLISPAHWQEFMGPNYRRIRAFADEHGIPVVSVDTDGNPDLIIPPMIKAGVNLLFPVEVAAGCDINELQKRYPTLAFMGGIDKRVLARDSQAIDKELKRIQPAIARGRYIADLDHLVPSDVSWENYCHYAQSLKQMVCSGS